MNVAKVRHCRACGAAGHRSDSERCPNYRAEEPSTLAIVPVASPPPVPIQLVASPDRVAQIAALREALDALSADIIWHEKIRALIEERLAEAYERRAVFEVEIRRLRRGCAP